jgi:hypothetical protein
MSIDLAVLPLSILYNEHRFTPCMPLFYSIFCAITEHMRLDNLKEKTFIFGSQTGKFKILCGPHTASAHDGKGKGKQAHEGETKHERWCCLKNSLM